MKDSLRSPFFILLLVAISISFNQVRDDKYTRITKVPDGFPMVPFPEDNKFTPERYELGKRLFYDPVLSIDKSISCASCHLPQHAFSDTLSLSLGVANRLGTRNAPSLANVAYHPYLMREGSVPTLEMQILVPIQEHNEMNHNIVEISELIKTDSIYNNMSIKAYNRPPEPYVITHAIACFERTLISGNSHYDKYINGNSNNTYTEEQKAGLELFFSDRVHCTNCHSGFNFTDYSFTNNGLYLNYKDEGRFRATGDSTELSVFKVPSLRNVGVTAPYMRDGSLHSLEEVIEFYNSGGQEHANKHPIIQPLGLSSEEQALLVTFLKTLTDSSFIRNTDYLPENFE